MTSMVAQEVHTFMCRDDKISDRQKVKAASMLRLAKHHYDLDHGEIALETGMHVNTIGKHAREESVPDAAALYKYALVISPRLLSLFFPQHLMLFQVPPGMDYTDAQKAIWDAAEQSTETTVTKFTLQR